MARFEPLNLVAIGVALLLAITVHEASHALAATLLGDPTGRRLGRLSLNPLVHLDPLGTLMMVVTALTGFGIGWGKPVPVNPLNLRFGPRNGMALVAVAGPISNVVSALVVMAVYVGIPWLVSVRSPLVGVQPLVANVMQYAIVINVALAVFNMLPIVPLDGSRVLMALLPRNLANKVEQYEAYGPGVLLAVIFMDQFLHVGLISSVMGPVMMFLLDIMARVVGGRYFVF